MFATRRRLKPGRHCPLAKCHPIPNNGSEDGPLARGHRLKERLKAVFALEDPDLAEEYLDKWIRSAQHCRIAY